MIRLYSTWNLPKFVCQPMSKNVFHRQFQQHWMYNIHIICLILELGGITKHLLISASFCFLSHFLDDSYYYFYYYSLRKYWLLDNIDFLEIVAFYVENFTSELLFFFSHVSSSQLIYIFVYKTRFVFVLCSSVNILTELWIKLIIIIITTIINQ